MQAVAEKIAIEHRTLQQTFSEFVFYHLILTCNQREFQTLFKVMGNSFYKLPFI